MRKLQRPALSTETERYLASQQASLEEGADIEEIWKRQRASASMRTVETALRNMTGLRERCMYCEDSRGTDIEHFWPRVPYRDRIFSWPNLLWVCSGCNRCKGKRFPVDVSGNPLLIDPTSEDPWDFWFYDGRTHEVTPRWEPDTGRQNQKALATLRILATLQHQAVTDGRKRTQRNLQRAVQTFLANAPAEEGSALSEFWEALRDGDGYGLVDWFFFREGREEQPFLALREGRVEVWIEITARLRAAGDDSASRR